MNEVHYITIKKGRTQSGRLTLKGKMYVILLARKALQKSLKSAQKGIAILSDGWCARTFEHEKTGIYLAFTG